MNLNLKDILGKLTTGTAAPTQDAVSAWLEKHGPELDAKARALLAPPLTISEVFDLIGAVVKAANDGLTVIPGADRKALVKAVVKYLFKTYAAERIPLYLRALLSDAVLDGVIEAIYGIVFKQK